MTLFRGNRLLLNWGQLIVIVSSYSSRRPGGGLLGFRRDNSVLLVDWIKRKEQWQITDYDERRRKRKQFPAIAATYGPVGAGGGGAQWFQIVKSRHKISSFDVISQVFPSKFQQICNYFCFQGMRFILVKLLQAQVWSVNFTNFHNLFLAGFCNLVQLCGGTAARPDFARSVNSIQTRMQIMFNTLLGPPPPDFLIFLRPCT